MVKGNKALKSLKPLLPKAILSIRIGTSLLDQVIQPIPRNIILFVLSLDYKNQKNYLLKTTEREKHKEKVKKTLLNSKIEISIGLGRVCHSPKTSLIVFFNKTECFVVARPFLEGDTIIFQVSSNINIINAGKDASRGVIYQYSTIPQGFQNDDYGVVQGPLGPSVFLLCINNISNISLKVKLFLFADNRALPLLS